MTKANLGKVSLVPRGAYSASETYQPLDIVSYNGGSFVARTENIGIEPSEGENWQQLASNADDGTYELIASIDASGLTQVTQEVSCKHLILFSSMPSGNKGTAAATIHLDTGGNFRVYWSVASASQQLYASIDRGYVKVRNGLASDSGSSPSLYAIAASTVKDQLDAANKPTKIVKIVMNSYKLEQYPTGTTFDIYAVKD